MTEELKQSRRAKFTKKRRKKTVLILTSSFCFILFIMIISKQQHLLSLNTTKEIKEEALISDPIKDHNEKETPVKEYVKESTKDSTGTEYTKEKIDLQEDSLNIGMEDITEEKRLVLHTTNGSSNLISTPITIPPTVGKQEESKEEPTQIKPKSTNLLVAPKEIIIEHIVTKGQTAFSISKNYFLSNQAQTLLTYNGISNPSTELKEGMKIKIPNPDIIAQITVNKGDTLFSITNTQYNRTNYLALLMKYNGIQHPEVDFKSGNYLYIPKNNQVITHHIQPKQTIYSIMNQYYDFPSIQSTIASFNGISNVDKDVKVNMVIKVPNLFKTDMNSSSAEKVEDDNLYIEINRAKNELTVFNKGEITYRTKVATGLNGATPQGTFTVSIKFVNPYYTPRKIAGGDPSNPLGTRWLGLSVPGTEGRTYGIHGTNKPSSIGGFASIGCIRMLNEEIEWLYDKIPIGTKVVIL
jgi:lipoprotein-anchoring transpeptidase ErfK/SrfK